MKPIAYKRPDGGISIVYPAPIEQLKRILGADLTEAQYEAHVRERSIPEDATDVFDLPSDAPTEDRYFRNACDIVEGKLTIDMPKARIIHEEKIRQARDKKLAELDIETLKGNDVQAEKQILRDLPANTDLSTATTPEELKAIWPEELN